VTQHTIHTKYRTILSPIPHPDSVPIIERLRRLEPRSMSEMPPLLWDRAEGFQVYDAFGNRWIDFTSAIILANAGHANPQIDLAIRRQLDARLFHSYCYPAEIRLRAMEALAAVLPPYLDKIFLLTTGSEASECAIKLARLHGRTIAPEKIHTISYLNSFHGRTMGAQTAGGLLDQHEWMGEVPPGFHHIPYPECPRCPWGKTRYDNCGAECLSRSLDSLAAGGLDLDLVAGVLSETFPGPTVAFMPLDYVRALREWTRERRALLIFDEIQAGFGRTGKWWGFLHYQVEPDLITLGKGMTGSLPMSAVVGRSDVLDIARPGNMSSTHTGNPLCSAALIANIEALRDGKLVENAADLEPVARDALLELRNRFARAIGPLHGRGLVWAFYLLNRETGDPDADLAKRVAVRCLETGLLLIETGRGTLKIAPPLCITREALLEGIACIGCALEKELSV